MWTIPKRNMIDIHAHLIPGVDDGAQDETMALTMLLNAVDQGITGVFLTPHSSAFDGDPERTWCRFESLAGKAAQFFPGLEIYAGCEVYCDEFSQDVTLERLRTGVYPAMNGTKFVLMEFSQWVTPESALRCVQAVAAEGWKPIIAHMERYGNLRENGKLVDQFRAMGALIQINAYSLAEESNDAILEFARKLVRERKADFLGTDCHRSYHRPPCAASGIRWLYENADEEYADALASGNARRLLCERRSEK